MRDVQVYGRKGMHYEKDAVYIQPECGDGNSKA